MIEYIIILSVGIVLIILSLSFFHKLNSLKNTGRTTDGIVYELSDAQNTSFNFSYPVIRFLTLKQEWITEPTKIGMFPGFYKKGQKVTVVYDEVNPKQFIIDSRINKAIVYIFLIAGCTLLLIGIYNLVGVVL